jgi:hypothetical protein
VTYRRACRSAVRLAVIIRTRQSLANSRHFPHHLTWGAQAVVRLAKRTLPPPHGHCGRCKSTGVLHRIDAQELLCMTRSLPPPRTVSVSRHRRRPYRYALALVLSSASIIAIVLLTAARPASLKEVLTQISSGLAASIIFAIIYTIFANREYAELIRAEITDQLASHLNDILHNIKQLNELFLPTDQYPATKDFDLRFNEDLTHDLCRSSFYFFRGTSAKYVPARLTLCNHHLEVAQIILLDPRDDNVIEARAADRRKRPEHEGKALPGIMAEIRSEILLGLIALFDCRDSCVIELGFSTVSSSVRIEVFDDAIYTALYSSAESQRHTHPESSRFGRDSQTYQIFRDECRRQMQLSSPHLRFTTRDTDADLISFASSLGFKSLDPTELARQRARYRDFILPFSKTLNTTRL